MIGAQVSGFNAHVLDKVLARYLPPVLKGMPPERRREVERMARDVRDAADHWDARTAGDGSAAVVDAAVEAESVAEEIGTEVAARLLGVRERRVRQLARDRWEPQGLARKVGPTWLVDRIAVQTYRDQRARSAA